MLQDLSAVSFVRAYQREALVLLKLLLLERKILFACEIAVHCMSTWLLTLVSLIPGQSFRRIWQTRGSSTHDFGRARALIGDGGVFRDAPRWSLNLRNCGWIVGRREGVLAPCDPFAPLCLHVRDRRYSCQSTIGQWWCYLSRSEWFAFFWYENSSKGTIYLLFDSLSPINIGGKTWRQRCMPIGVRVIYWRSLYCFLLKRSTLPLWPPKWLPSFICLAYKDLTSVAALFCFATSCHEMSVGLKEYYLRS